MNKGYALLLVTVMGQATNNDGAELLGRLGFYTLLGVTGVLIEGSDSVSLSVDKTNFDYAETKMDGSLSNTEQTTHLMGGTFGVHPKGDKGLYFKTRFAAGDTNYVGRLLGSSGGYGSYKGLTHNILSDSTLGFSMPLPVANPWNLTIPIRGGVGYRGWYRNLNAYSEYYDWGYVTVGTGVQYSPNSRLNLGIDVDYQKAFSAGMRRSWYTETYFDLKNVYGYSITTPLRYTLNEHYSFIAQYRYEMWNINHSEIISGFYEPDSRTKNHIVSVGVSYRY